MKRPRTKVQRYISPSIITGMLVVALTIQPCLQRGAIVTTCPRGGTTRERTTRTFADEDEGRLVGLAIARVVDSQPTNDS